MCVNVKPHPGAAVAHAVCQMQDMIKGATALTGWNLESHTRGMEALRCYTSTGDCRHAALVNFFQPGALDTQGPCEGGCDNCTRRCAAGSRGWKMQQCCFSAVDSVSVGFVLLLTRCCSVCCVLMFLQAVCRPWCGSRHRHHSACPPAGRSCEGPPGELCLLCGSNARLVLSGLAVERELCHRSTDGP